MKLSERIKKRKMKTTAFIYICVISLLITGEQALAQVSPLINMYYQNQYLANPAMASADEGLVLGTAYKHAFTGGNGTTQTNAFTAEYQVNPKMGIGLNITTDKDGLIRNNRYVATYAYHLQINERDRLHFGLSAGIATEQLNVSDIIGDTGDPLVQQYNDRGPYADADFGIAYIAEKFTVQGVIPNLRGVFQNMDHNAYMPSTFFTAISYKYSTDGIKLEPKIVYRGLKHFDNVFEAALNASLLDDKVNALAIYHSTDNITVGLGYRHQKQFQFQIAYNAPINSNLNKYTSGNVELGLKINLLNSSR